jgi:hypothetical protein
MRHTNVRLPLVIKASVSPFGHKSRRISNINLTETRQKVERLLFTLHEPSLCLGDTGASNFSRSETITFGRVSDLCLLFEFLT